MGKPLSEEIKTKISEHYKTSDQSMGAIAQALGVSERTVRRYKDYSGLGRPRPDNNRKARPPSPEASPMTRPHGQAIEETERPSQNEADQALDSTDRTRPDASHVDEEPKGITFIGGKKKHKEPEPVEEEPEKPEIDWKAINEKKKRDDDIATVVLIGGGLAGLGILGYLAHRSKNNNQNFSQPSWNNQGTPWS